MDATREGLGGSKNTYLKYSLEFTSRLPLRTAEGEIEGRNRQRANGKEEEEEKRRERKKEKKEVNQKCSAMLRKRGRRGGSRKKKCDRESPVMQQAAKGSWVLCRGDCRRLHAKASRGRTRLDHRLAGSFMPASVDRRDMRVCACACGNDYVRMSVWRGVRASWSGLVWSGTVCRGGR